MMTYIQLSVGPIASTSTSSNPPSDGFYGSFSVSLPGVGAELKIETQDPWVLFMFDENLLQIDRTADAASRERLRQLPDDRILVEESHHVDLSNDDPTARRQQAVAAGERRLVKLSTLLQTRTGMKRLLHANRQHANRQYLAPNVSYATATAAAANGIDSYSSDDRSQGSSSRSDDDSVITTDVGEQGAGAAHQPTVVCATSCFGQTLVAFPLSAFTTRPEHAPQQTPKTVGGALELFRSWEWFASDKTPIDLLSTLCTKCSFLNAYSCSGVEQDRVAIATDTLVEMPSGIVDLAQDRADRLYV